MDPMTTETFADDLAAGRWEVRLPGPSSAYGDKLILIAVVTGQGVRLLVHPNFAALPLELRTALLELSDELREIAGADLKVVPVTSGDGAQDMT